MSTLKQTPPINATKPNGLHRAVLMVALLNLGYGLIEFSIAWGIGSVSLFADSVDFFEDTSVNLLIFFALAWSLKARAQVGMALAAILLVPALATLWTAWDKLQSFAPPDAVPLSLVGGGALTINLLCAFLLAKHRHHHGSLTKAAFLSARNDAYANIAIIAAGLMTAFVWRSAWPDLIVGLGIFAINLDAAREVWRAAREEHKAAKEEPT